MRLRKIGKMNKPQDGSRSLYESIMNSHVLTAMKYLSHNNIDFVIIGNIAISYHVKPFMCKTIDILVLNKTDIRFKYFPNNRCKNIGLNIKDINDVGISKKQYENILKSSIVSDKFKIASPTSLINLILSNEINIDTKSELYTICSNCIINIENIFTNKNFIKDFLFNIKMDYNMSNIKKFEDYFKCKIYEGSSGYAEVDSAFKDWINRTKDINQVLIGGMAMVNYGIEDRTTTDIDFIFLTQDDIPSDVQGFKKTRNSAFQHNRTHVEIEVLTPRFLDLNQEFVELVFETSYDKGNFKIASPSAIVALKLGRFNERDIKDIKNLILNFEVDIIDFMIYLSEEEIENYNIVLKEIKKEL